MWAPTTDTRLTLLASFLDENLSGSRGALPVEGTLQANPNGALPRSRVDSEPSDRFRRRQYSLGYEFEQALKGEAVFQSKLRHADVNFRQNDFSYASGWVSDADGRPVDYRTVHRQMLSFPGRHRALTADNSVRLDVDTGAVRHRLLAGVDYQRVRQAYQLGFGEIPDLDLYAPVYGLPFALPTLDSALGQRLDQLGFYAQDQMKLGRVLLTLSGRHDRTRSAAISGPLTSPTAASQKDSAYTGRVGLGYLFNPGLTSYVSYSTSFQPAIGFDLLGRAFEPTTGRQLEAGIKYQPAGGKLSATASVFRLVQQNLLTADPANPTFQRQTGEVRINGVELEGKAHLVDSLDLTLAATWLDPVVTRNNDGLEGKRLAGAPRVQLSSWMNYRPAYGLELGLGLRHMGATLNDSNTLRTPAYTLVDAAVHLDLVRMDPAWTGSRLSLTANNLTDKVYVNNCAWGKCYYGASRTVMLAYSQTW